MGRKKCQNDKEMERYESVELIRIVGKLPVRRKDEY